jgi:hypothetical protein
MRRDVRQHPADGLHVIAATMAFQIAYGPDDEIEIKKKEAAN